MKTLVLVEHDGQSIKDSTLATVSAAAKLGDVHLLAGGNERSGDGVYAWCPSFLPFTARAAEAS